MPQSLIRMPKMADFKIAETRFAIRDHEVMFGGLWIKTMHIVTGPFSYRQMLSEFENHGISYEMIIEECIRELEKDPEVFASAIHWHYNIDTSKYDTQGSMEATHNFSKSDAGRKMADQHMEKIRSCNNWEDLYDVMQQTSGFSMDMQKRIIKEIKQQCRKV